MELPVEDFSSYQAVASFAELLGPGSRIFELPPELVPRAPLKIAGGQTHLPFRNDQERPIAMRCAKVARALCVRRGVVIDLDTRRVLPDVLHKPPPLLPRSVEVDLSMLGIEPGVEWERVPAQTERSPGFYADCRHLGYGHVLLEGLSRCWALAKVEPLDGVVVANKRARTGYLPWFEALGVPLQRLRSTRKGPLRVNDLIVPSQSYVLDRGMSPRFHELTRHIALEMGGARGCDRLFASRRDATKRRLVNEAEIEELFREKGFRIFHPEEHTVEEQVRAFAGASVVAGPVGSALYSVAFSPRTTRLLVLAPDSFRTRNDQILAGARDHPPLYAFGRSPMRRRRDAAGADWHLDPAIAQAALDQILLRGTGRAAE